MEGLVDNLVSVRALTRQTGHKLLFDGDTALLVDIDDFDHIVSKTKEEEIGLIQQIRHTGGNNSKRMNRFRLGNTTAAQARKNTANNNVCLKYFS